MLISFFNICQKIYNVSHKTFGENVDRSIYQLSYILNINNSEQCVIADSQTAKYYNKTSCRATVGAGPIISKYSLITLENSAN